MTQYETIYILRAELEDEPRKALIDRFNALIESAGTLGTVEEWGQRRLAYPIDFKNEGYYVLVNFEAEADFPAELERNFRIADDVLRYIVVRKE